MRVATSFVQAPLNLKTLTRARCVGLNFRRCRRMFLDVPQAVVQSRCYI